MTLDSALFGAVQFSHYLKKIGAVITVLVFALTQAAFAQTGRPISGVIAATDKPIAISYVNEEGKTIGRIAGVGEPIYLNDEITTPAGASLQVLLRDQTVFSIGPNSTLVFDEFIFDPTASDELALTASVKKGTFKFISGKISKLKPGAMTLKLPNATASVRGTSVLGRVDDTGASDIVLLTGAVQLQSAGAAVPVDLITPGWGVSIADTGAASEPEPFPEEAINEIIQQVELVAEETEDAATGTDEAAAEEQQSEEAEAEAVETVVTAVRDAGEEVTEEEIAQIIEESEGNPEAVAEAIVKVIIENQIERGDIAPETLAALETIDGEALLSGDIDPEALAAADIVFEQLNVEDIKIEDLGLTGFEFDGQTNFVDAFSERLDEDGFELPSFSEADFAFTRADFGFGGGEFEEVIFEPSAFEKEFAVSQKFDIKDVSNLIIGNEFENADAPEFELSFFDILYNAETINEEVSRREVIFGGFGIEESSFDDKEQDSDFAEQAGAFGDAGSRAVQPGADGAKVEFAEPTFSVSRDATTGLARVVFSRGDAEAGETAVEVPVTELSEAGDAPVELSPIEAPVINSEAGTLLSQLVETEQPEYIESSPFLLPIDEKAEEESRDEFLAFLEQVQLDYANSEIDPLEYYKAGKTGAVWLTLQNDGSLGNQPNIDQLISESYEGSARFLDQVTLSDQNTAFKALSSYDVTVNYDTSAVTGTFILSNMSLNNVNFVGPTGETSYSYAISETLSSSPNKMPITDSSGAVTGGNDENNNGVLNTGETIEGVRIAEVDFHNSATGADINSRVRTTLDMSVGSTVAVNAALDGTLGEFSITSEHYNCTANCATATKTGGVGAAISQVAAE